MIGLGARTAIVPLLCALSTEGAQGTLYMIYSGGSVGVASQWGLGSGSRTWAGVYERAWPRCTRPQHPARSPGQPGQAWPWSAGSPRRSDSLHLSSSSFADFDPSLPSGDGYLNLPHGDGAQAARPYVYAPSALGVIARFRRDEVRPRSSSIILPTRPGSLPGRMAEETAGPDPSRRRPERVRMACLPRPC
jgi:hypothetical protein